MQEQDTIKNVKVLAEWLFFLNPKIRNPSEFYQLRVLPLQEVWHKHFRNDLTVNFFLIVALCLHTVHNQQQTVLLSPPQYHLILVGVNQERCHMLYDWNLLLMDWCPKEKILYQLSFWGNLQQSVSITESSKQNLLWKLIFLNYPMNC